MTGWWDKQIQRADLLTPQSDGARELLAFYAQLLRAQKEIYEFFRGLKDWLPSGTLAQELPVIREAFPILLQTVMAHGPGTLAAEAHDLSKTNRDLIDEILTTYWCSPSDSHFFGKAFWQPYYRWLADTGVERPKREVVEGERVCPFCGGNPQVSFLQNKEAGAESGNRNLICATCLSSWEFRRVVCAKCGEERPAHLAYFQSPQYDHVRIEACDSCKYYLKGVDLTRFGNAQPLVDEVAAAPLDLWAQEHGYSKIELNLVGL